VCGICAGEKYRIYFCGDDRENYIVLERDSAHIRVERIIWRTAANRIETTGEKKTLAGAILSIVTDIRVQRTNFILFLFF
jgi:hypothetical protein